jgi:hypothetical protein
MKKSFKVAKSTKINLNNEEYLLEKGDKIFVSSDTPSRTEIADWLYNYLLENKGEEVSSSDICANYPFDVCILNSEFAFELAELIDEVEIEYHVNIDFKDDGNGLYDYVYILL